jgi:SAM-dependent methyltransferase
VNPLTRIRDLLGTRREDRIVVRDPFAHGLFPVCVATHDLGLRRLFDLATVLMLLECRPGDRVLDLGAGCGFSSEMLARLGYTVVAIDPDHTALQHNRNRLTFDRTRIDGHVNVVRALAERLPIATASVDGVVGLNVMHHVPDLAGATTELARVLKPGGHAVFCEPGLEHLEASETKRAIAEFGENDQPFDVIAFLHAARALGFSDACLCATLQSPLRVVPVQDVELFASGEHPTRTLTERGVLDELHRRHAFAVLVREGARERTSRAPGVLRADIRVEGIPERIRRGRRYQAIAHVVNLGDTRWLSQPSQLGGFVTVGCKVSLRDGRLVNDTFGRTYISADVPPQGRASIPLKLQVPGELTPGTYELRFDLVNELVCWFSDLPGNTPHTVRVDVE